MQSCPNPTCRVKAPLIIKKGYFVTKWNAQPVPRYRCKGCGKHFSSHTSRESYRHRKPYLNHEIFRWYSSGTTQRRIAKVMKINRKTVVRKFLFMARLARREHDKNVQLGNIPSSVIHFDEMESFEHTRLKPLSIAIAVSAKSGKIIDARVAKMNCHGKLAAISRFKYGMREDTRNIARNRVLRAAGRCSHPPVRIVTDKHPHYSDLIKRCLPNAEHSQVERIKKTLTTAITKRQNEKDALFTLNYTAAKIRHDLSRMARKVWVTTKKAERLQAHLDLYIAYNNQYKLAQ